MAYKYECTKTAYDNSADANRDLAKLKHHSKRKDKKIPTRWYLCDDCGKIHLTSQPKLFGNEKGRNGVKGRKFRF